MKKHKLQWHPAFFAGLQIELKDEADNLIFENEHQLGTKPKEIDILVIKKQKDVPIRKNLGRIFRQHNIIEYKSPTDYISIDDFYKGCAYALFYKSDTTTQNEIRIDDITLTFVCVKYPRTLIKHLAETHNYSIEEVDNGIYYVNKPDEMLPIQIIVTSRLNSDENLWLRSLTNQLKDENDAKRLFNEFETNIENKLYESVMDIIIRANTINVLKEDSNMSEVIKTWIGSLREDAINEGRNEGIRQGIRQGIEAFIMVSLEENKSEEFIISKLMKFYKISEAEAKEYFDKYALVSE